MNVDILLEHIGFVTVNNADISVHAALPYWPADPGEGEMMHFHARRKKIAKCWAEFLLQCLTTSTVHACFITDCSRACLLSQCINFLLIWDFLAVPFSTFMNLAELDSLVESQVSFFKQLLSQSIWWHSANYKCLLGSSVLWYNSEQVPMPPETWCWTCVVQWSH